MIKLINLLVIIGCIAVVFAACKKDNIVPEEVEVDGSLLTEISRNGFTHIELFYDVNKRLYRVNYHNNFGVLSSYNLYEYDEKGIKESRRHDADDHTLEYRTVFTLDNFGRVIKADNYGSPPFDQINSISEFGYNTSGQLINKQFRSAGQPLYYRDEYTYDSLNNLISIERILYPNQPDEYLYYRNSYTPGAKAIPEHWHNYVFLLSISGLDDSVRDMFCTHSSIQSWNSDQELTLELSFESSETVFHDNGHLLRQVITRKNILNPGTDLESEMTYEYFE